MSTGVEPQPSPPSRQRPHEAAWERRLQASVRQSPLLETQPSLEALSRARLPRRPDVVFSGIGLCTRHRLSVGLPVDVLGLLLPAEALRRAMGSPWLVVLIADNHAVQAGFDLIAVEERAREVELLLGRIRDVLRLPRLRILRASAFQGRASYQRLHDLVRGRADHASDYFTREIADVEYLRRQWGEVLKVDWTISRDGESPRVADEVAFDARFRRWMGEHVGFVYTKAGRVLDDRRPKAPPYTVVDPSRRILLHPREDVSAKLTAASARVETSTWRGVRRHLTALSRVQRQLTGAGAGPVEARLQQLIRAITGGGRNCSSA